MRTYSGLMALVCTVAASILFTLVVFVRELMCVCVTRSQTTSLHAAACHGLWYVDVEKTGTLHRDKNYEAGVWYKPQANWL